MSNSLSQEEIEALLKGELGGEESAEDTSTAVEEKTQDSELLVPEEMDAMGEVGNISMGTAATTLNTLLNKVVSITTPRVEVTSMQEISERFPLPFVAVEVQYTKGLVGNNLLFLREQDVKIITDLMLGGDGTNIGGEVGELHLSAISEVMNQMVGSSSTSLAKMMAVSIDISPPRAYRVNLAEEITEPVFMLNEPIIKTSFTMQVEDLINSEIMQIMPLEFGKALIDGLLSGSMPQEATQESGSNFASAAEYDTPPAAAQTSMQGRAPAASKPEPRYEPEPAPQPARREPQRAVEVRPVQYNTFDDGERYETLPDNMGLLMDVPLSVSVELGKSSKYIKEILDFNVGTIIVLDKMAGELVDIVVNGKLIARGEVVVIDDSYGTRITDIISPAKRIVPPR